ncbi:hypothetical protein MY10362_006416, partial [Beauveria mimosiformis]
MVLSNTDKHASTSISTPPLSSNYDDNDNDNDDEYPGGGLVAWTVVLGAWCAMLPSMGLLNTLAALEAHLAPSLELRGVPRTRSAWIFSCYAFFLYFCGAQVGPLFDAHDVRVLLVMGAAGMVAALVGLSFSTGHWFDKRRALATGVACTAGGIGGVIFPILILYLAPTLGFAWSIRVIALLCAVVLAVACVTLRKRRRPGIKTSSGGGGGAALDFSALWRDKKFGATTAAVFLVEFAVFIPYTYLSSYALHVGMAPDKAYLLNALLNAGAVPGRAIPGYVGDKVGAFNTMCVTSSVCAACIFGMWYNGAGSGVGGRGGLVTALQAFSVVFGFWSGAAISLTPVCVGRVCGATEDLGRRTGT